MLIAIDIYGCYDRDPELWLHFITQARKSGHHFVAVSGGNAKQPKHEGYKDLEALGIPVYWTNRKAKEPFLRRIGIIPDVWIDDKPLKILKST